MHYGCRDKPRHLSANAAKGLCASRKSQLRTGKAANGPISRSVKPATNGRKRAVSGLFDNPTEHRFLDRALPSLAQIV